MTKRWMRYFLNETADPKVLKDAADDPHHPLRNAAGAFGDREDVKTQLEVLYMYYLEYDELEDDIGPMNIGYIEQAIEKAYPGALTRGGIPSDLVDILNRHKKVRKDDAYWN